MRHWTHVAGYFFLLCCLRACSLCRAPDGFDPAPMEKEGVDGDPDSERTNEDTGPELNANVADFNNFSFWDSSQICLHLHSRS